ncbi:17113_t:CDS:2 [Dentiscutata heterogama]|uniref:17113_t:CDS:1 n=1 Tax=Dentiscutata heterogama TaxID=1316150 RepID=A0ACA9NZS0_9GLOM|nr:17113_t:CDS:2 [Dentiscutata heterogama]
MDDFDIEWNSPLCQICWVNRCDVIKYPEYEKYCKKCIHHVEFIIGTEQKKISTNIDILLKKFPNSFFSHMIKDVFQNERQEIVSKNTNMTLNNELWFFTGEEYIIPFEFEDFCDCGTLKQKKYRNCKTCQENLVKERVPWCFECEIRTLQTNIKRKRTRLMNDYKKNLAKLNDDEKKQIEIINKKYIQEKLNINEKIKKKEHELKSEDNFKDVIKGEITANKRQRKNTEDIVIIDEEIRNNVNTFLVISQERFEQIDRNRN